MPKRLPKQLRVRNAIRNGAKSMNRPSHPTRERVDASGRRSCPSARPTEERRPFHPHTSFFRRGVVSIACSAATMLMDCDRRKISRWMTSQHPSRPRSSATFLTRSKVTAFAAATNLTCLTQAAPSTSLTCQRASARHLLPLAVSTAAPRATPGTARGRRTAHPCGSGFPQLPWCVSSAKQERRTQRSALYRRCSRPSPLSTVPPLLMEAM